MELEAALPIGFGCTIMISNGTRLPRTADRSALLRAILSPRDHELGGEDRYPRLSMTAQQQRDATLDAIVAWLIETAERTPVLMAWEDLHWADPTNRKHWAC